MVGIDVFSFMFGKEIGEETGGGGLSADSLTITSNPTKTSYFVGDTLDLTGLAVSATVGELSGEVTADCKISPASGTILTKAGAQTITVSYGGMKQTCSVTAYEVDEIEVTQAPNKITYTPGDTLDLTGIVVTGYANSKAISKEVTSDCTFSPTNGTILTTEGSNTITVTYGSFSTSFNVTVSSRIMFIDAPVNMTDGSIIVFNNELKFFNINNDYNDYYSWDNVNREWVMCAAPVTHKYGSVTTLYDNKIYIAGGEGSYYQNAINRFIPDPTDVTKYINYVRNGNCPQKIYASGVVVYNDKLHIIGGFYNKKSHSVFDGDAWVQLDDLPIDMYPCAAVVYDNKIHVFSSYEHYTYDGTSWEYLETLDFYVNKAGVYAGKIVYTTTTDNKLHQWNGISWNSDVELPISANRNEAIGVFNGELVLAGFQNNSLGKKIYTWNGSSWLTSETPT